MGTATDSMRLRLWMLTGTGSILKKLHNVNPAVVPPPVEDILICSLEAPSLSASMTTFISLVDRSSVIDWVKWIMCRLKGLILLGDYYRHAPRYCISV